MVADPISCEALITREFEEVRKKIVEETNPRKKFHEFAFVKMMTCGECGSGITCLEKEKVLQTTKESVFYRYYVCSRAHNRRCKNPYIREEALIGQLCGIIDEIEIDRLGARRIIDKEIGRFNKMQAQVLGVKEWDKPRDVDIKRYAKYLLEEGSVDEKRELLEQLRGKLTLKDKRICLKGD